MVFLQKAPDPPVGFYCKEQVFYLAQNISDETKLNEISLMINNKLSPSTNSTELSYYRDQKGTNANINAIFNEKWFNRCWRVTSTFTDEGT